MCQIFKDITFCTCGSSDIDALTELNDYWILYRYNEKLDVIIVGEVIYDTLIKQAIPNNLVEIVLEKLNNHSLFDKSLDFENNDRLHVYITLNDIGLNYGFEYNQGNWQEIEYDYFTWVNKFEAIKGGELKSK
jgi:hypothetical protein